MDSIIATMLKNKNKKLTTAIATIYTEELNSEGNSNIIQGMFQGCEFQSLPQISLTFVNLTFLKKLSCYQKKHVLILFVLFINSLKSAFAGQNFAQILNINSVYCCYKLLSQISVDCRFPEHIQTVNGDIVDLIFG